MILSTIEGIQMNKLCKVLSLYRYYVDEGEIHLLEENSKKVLEIKRKGDIFGEY
jgi:hypothetical protein